MLSVIKFILKAVMLLIVAALLIAFVSGVLFVKKFMLTEAENTKIEQQYKKDTSNQNHKSKYHAKHHRRQR